MQRILEYFLLYEQQQLQKQQPGPLAISKLLDNYLAEIARDPNLPVMKFQFLAQSLPENARTSDDGLYRAIDTYLKVICYSFFRCIYLLLLNDLIIDVLSYRLTRHYQSMKGEGCVKF